MQSIERIIQEEVNVKALELMPEDHPLMQRKARQILKPGSSVRQENESYCCLYCPIGSDELKNFSKGTMR